MFDGFLLSEGQKGGTRATGGVRMTDYLICGRRNRLVELMMPLIDVECCKCGAALCMDARNEAAAREYRKICAKRAVKVC